MIVGGEAVIFYGHARYTGDVDFFYSDEDKNAKVLFDALSVFWEGNIPEINNFAELQVPGQILQFGRPPNRIDLLNQIDGVHFDEAWPHRKKVELEAEPIPIPINYLDLGNLIKNKEASARPKDLDDLKYLKSSKKSD